MRSVLFLLVSLLALLGLEHPAAAQPEPTGPHVVAPGDTWTALAWSYGVRAEDLQALSGHINTSRQPAIGDTISIPQHGTAATGTVWRTAEGGLLQTAVLGNESAWQLALASGLFSPYQPGLWRPLLGRGDAPVQELPVGVNALELAPERPVPGQALAAHLHLKPAVDSVSLALDDDPFAMTTRDSDAVAVGGTGAFAEPGQPELSIRVGQAPVWRQPWVIAGRDWVFQQLSLTGEAAEIDQAAIQAERERLATVWSQVTPVAQWSAPFRLPIDDYLEISADYGARRSYNGGPYRSFHEGTDFSAFRGTPVYAPAAGTVVIAEPLFVRGGAVILDHGLGIFTGYYHLSAVHVEPGQQVLQGDLLGEVGTTGLSTGNHLHWDLIINGTWVDAMSWLEQDTGCWILLASGDSCEPAR